MMVLSMTATAAFSIGSRSATMRQFVGGGH
jgi:hypothetical protein